MSKQSAKQLTLDNAPESRLVIRLLLPEKGLQSFLTLSLEQLHLTICQHPLQACPFCIRLYQQYHLLIFCEQEISVVKYLDWQVQGQSNYIFAFSVRKTEYVAFVRAIILSFFFIPFSS